MNFNKIIIGTNPYLFVYHNENDTHIVYNNQEMKDVFRLIYFKDAPNVALNISKSAMGFFIDRGVNINGMFEQMSILYKYNFEYVY